MGQKIVAAIDYAALWVAHNPKTSLVIFAVGLILAVVLL